MSIASELHDTSRIASSKIVAARRLIDGCRKGEVVVEATLSIGVVSRQEDRRNLGGKGRNLAMRRVLSGGIGTHAVNRVAQKEFLRVSGIAREHDGVIALLDDDREVPGAVSGRRHEANVAAAGEPLAG